MDDHELYDDQRLIDQWDEDDFTRDEPEWPWTVIEEEE